MKVVIEGNPKEFAALVLELQERQGSVSGDELADKVMRNLQQSRDRA